MGNNLSYKYIFICGHCNDLHKNKKNINKTYLDYKYTKNFHCFHHSIFIRENYPFCYIKVECMKCFVFNDYIFQDYSYFFYSSEALSMFLLRWSSRFPDLWVFDV